MMRSPKVRVLASGGGSRPRLAAAPLISETTSGFSDFRIRRPLFPSPSGTTAAGSTCNKGLPPIAALAVPLLFTYMLSM